jgi:CheY-like chemotaxis protein
MRLRIRRVPTEAVAGFRLDHFRPGLVYDIGTPLAHVFLAEGWAEPARDERAVPVGPEGRSAVVLVVDDHADLRQAVATLLKASGYDVVEACHGMEGIARLRECSPALVILDLEMPVMDGWAFRAAQRRLADTALAAIPVVLLTGADDADYHFAALEAAGLVQKPFDPDGLLNAVQAALSH